MKSSPRILFPEVLLIPAGKISFNQADLDNV